MTSRSRLLKKGKSWRNDGPLARPSARNLRSMKRRNRRMRVKPGPIEVPAGSNHARLLVRAKLRRWRAQAAAGEVPEKEAPYLPTRNRQRRINARERSIGAHTSYAVSETPVP